MGIATHFQGSQQYICAIIKITDLEFKTNPTTVTHDLYCIKAITTQKCLH